MSRLLERRARARVTYVTVTPFRVLLSPSLASNLLLLLWYLTPPLSSRGSRYAHLPLPSLRQIAIPLLSLPSPLSFVAAVARSGRWPRDHIVCISHTTLFVYICARICKRITRTQPRTTVTDRRLFYQLLVSSSLHFHGK